MIATIHGRFVSLVETPYTMNGTQGVSHQVQLAQDGEQGVVVVKFAQRVVAEFEKLRNVQMGADVSIEARYFPASMKDSDTPGRPPYLQKSSWSFVAFAQPAKAKAGAAA